MNEANLRKWHRGIGVIVAVFAAFQVATGIGLSIENLMHTYWGGILHDLHEGYGVIGNATRLVLGGALLWMIVSGWLIYWSIRRRQAQRKP